MNIRPLYDRIIVKRVDQEKQTASGIVIPDSAKEKPEQGEVVAVGNGRLMQDGNLQPLLVKNGETVLFGKYAGQTVKLDGEEYLVLKEEDVLGIIESKSGGQARKAA
jgi:chaperonin GroES